MRSITDRLRVMVVEDEPRLRSLMNDVIPEMGFDVRVFSTAEAALHRFEQEPADIMLLDLHLPGMSGIDLLKTLKQKWPLTQAVFMTAFGELDSAREAMRLDAVDFLSKPSPLSEIEIALDRARRRIQNTRSIREETTEESTDDVRTNLAAQETKLINEVLTRHHGNQSAAARELGISRRTLYNKLRQRNQ